MATFRSKPSAGTDDQVLTSALLRAADFWELSQGALAQILHVSPATVSRWFGRHSRVGAESAEGQLAKLLLRVFRSLDTLVGGQPEKAKAWLRSPNHHLGAVPQERLRTVEGLVHVAEYLDAMRGTV